MPLAACEGRLCGGGVCVAPLEECDARLHCPDLSDELPACPPLVTTCVPSNTSVDGTSVDSKQTCGECLKLFGFVCNCLFVSNCWFVIV